MANDNIFSGLRVVDLASFIAGPSAAVIMSDFGADVIKVEPPTGDLWRHGHQVAPQPQAKDAYPWHLANRNKRGMTLDLKSPSATQVLEKLVKWADVLICNTPHPARQKLKIEYDDVVQWNTRLIYADVTGFGDKGPDANLPGFDITSYWARSGLLSMTRDAGVPPTWPVAGSGDNATAVGLFSAIVSIAASAPARDHMSQRRCSPKGFGQRASRSRRRYARPISLPRTIARTRQMRHSTYIAPPTAPGSS
jgi:crotonobetainyl-CoA:carnitine CoA-transferase CaiB-like acyl-CoA transferase